MSASTHSVRSFKTNLCIAAVTFVVIGYAMSAHSQQTTSSSQTTEIDVSQLRPGMCCEVRTKTPSVQRRDPDDADDGGTVKEITEDEIVVTQHHACADMYGIPILSDLPLVGKFFTKVDTRSWETTSRIPINEIAGIKVLKPDQPQSSRR